MQNLSVGLPQVNAQTGGRDSIRDEIGVLIARDTEERRDPESCECLFHRYHVVHICACGKLISHSQAEMDEHRGHGPKESYPAALYHHGDAAKDLRARVLDPEDYR